MRLLFTLLALLTSASVFAAQAPELVPVRASDQKEITSESLDKEFQQLLAISAFHKAKNKLKMTQIRFEQAKRDLARGKELKKSGTITESKFSALYFEYRILEADAINLPIDIAKYRMTAQYHGLRVMEEGNRGDDHRKDQAALMLAGVELEIKTLMGSLELAKTAKELATNFVANGKTLSAKSALSAAELERREVTLQSALLHIEDIESQIALAQLAREGFARSITRL